MVVLNVEVLAVNLSLNFCGERRRDTAQGRRLTSRRLAYCGNGFNSTIIRQLRNQGDRKVLLFVLGGVGNYREMGSTKLGSSY